MEKKTKTSLATDATQVSNAAAPNVNKTVECTKCHKQVIPTNGQQAHKGFVCNECIAAQRKRKRNIIGGSCASLLVAAGIATGIYVSSPTDRTVSGFAGVGEIADSMVVNVDSTKVTFDMSTATATSALVSTQAPISNIAEFKRAVKNNIADAKNGKFSNIVIPSVGTMFEINTNYFVNGGEDVVKELAQTFLKTNKQATILVEGYTCDFGGEQLNTTLSKLRAEAVKKLLVDVGVPSDKIETKWYGKSRYKDFNYPNKSDYRRVIVSIR